MKAGKCAKARWDKRATVLCDSLSYMCRCHTIKRQNTTSIIISVSPTLLPSDLVELIKPQHNKASIFCAVVEDWAPYNKAGLECCYSLYNESELRFVRHAGNHNYIIMNYAQGGRQVQLQTLWIEQIWSLVIGRY